MVPLMSTAADLHARRWRVRRRHDHLDAEIVEADGAWRLTYRRNDRPLVTWAFLDRASAAAEADRRLRELQLAGWNLHW